MAKSKTTFKKGESGNPNGRPLGSKHRLRESFIKALAEDFEENGIAAIQVVRAEQPKEYLSLIAGILPKEVDVKSDHTVTHKHEGLSATAGFIAEALGREADRPSSQPLPN